MLDLGIDESGEKSSRGHLLVVSAQVGATKRIAKLSKKWDADLVDLKVPYFHAQELWNRQAKIYKHLSRSKRKEFLDRVLRHSGKYVDWGFTVYVDPDEYVKETTQRFRSQWGSPYGFLIQMVCLTLYLKLRQLGRQAETVNVLIEDGHRNSGQAIQLIKEMSERETSFIRVGNYGLGKKAGNPILQSADALAYAACEQIRKGQSALMKKLISSGKTEYYLTRCDVDVIAEMKAGVKLHFDNRKLAALERLRLMA